MYGLIEIDEPFRQDKSAHLRGVNKSKTIDVISTTFCFFLFIYVVY